MFANLLRHFSISSLADESNPGDPQISRDSAMLRYACSAVLQSSISVGVKERRCFLVEEFLDFCFVFI